MSKDFLKNDLCCNSRSAFRQQVALHPHLCIGDDGNAVLLHNAQGSFPLAIWTCRQDGVACTHTPASLEA